MKIDIVCVGKLKEKYLKDAVADYGKRLSRLCKLEIIEVDDLSIPENPLPAACDKVKATEMERVKKQIRNGAYVVVLDVEGTRLTSEKLSQKIHGLGVSGISAICFVIGGSLGLHEELLKTADFRMSMSDLTFTHQLARLILVEQLLRVCKVNAGEPYAK